MNYWFTSDYHLGHFNIIKYCNRPFKTLEAMNNTIIRKHNERVKPEDIVFHIGDFCFKNSPGGKSGEGVRTPAIEWEKKLNGKIIHIQGNHDNNNSTKTIIRNLTIKYGGKRVNLVHNPDHASLSHEINFCGHIHNKWKFMKTPITILVNIGVDVWNFYPQTFQNIMSKLNHWKHQYD